MKNLYNSRLLAKKRQEKKEEEEFKQATYKAIQELLHGVSALLKLGNHFLNKENEEVKKNITRSYIGQNVRKN